jgi:hypothetical protein
VARGQQFDAGQLLRHEAEPQQFEQVRAAAGADLEQAKAGEIVPAAPCEQPEHRPLALREGHPDVRFQGVVAVVIDTPCIALGDSVRLGARRLLGHRSGRRPTASRKRSARTG